MREILGKIYRNSAFNQFYCTKYSYNTYNILLYRY